MPERRVRLFSPGSNPDDAKTVAGLLVTILAGLMFASTGIYVASIQGTSPEELVDIRNTIFIQAGLLGAGLFFRQLIGSGFLVGPLWKLN